MKTITILAAALSLSSTAAVAGVNKTWVSGSGVDTGTCPFSAPCKTFQYAHDQTNSGGEVDVKDSGGYGTVVITKAISIVSEGVLASVNVPPGGTGITVQAGSSDVVTLRGLTVDSFNGGGTGISVKSAILTTIDHCSWNNGHYGVYIDDAAGVVLIKDNSIINNEDGIFVNNVGMAFVSMNTIMGNRSWGIYSSVDNKVYTLGDNVQYNFGNENSGNLVLGGKQ